jgi:L-fuconolactonase
MAVVDSHQHFWDPAVTEFGWMTEAHEPIRRRFAPEDLRPVLAANGVDATVLVQTWHSRDETRNFLATAAETDFVAGVVGWVGLADPAVGQILAELKGGPHGRYLVGVRHLVHDEPDPNWLLRDEVRHGLTILAERGLAYDLLLKIREIPAALRTVADFPTLRFVVDHIAKPDIKAGAISPWTELISGFALHRDHVWCKLSGMAEEADWTLWTPNDLKPFIDRALEVFGPNRCMFGSNWPVCLLAGDYRRIKNALEQCIAALSADERAEVMGGSAIAAYELQAPRPWKPGVARETDRG